MFGKKKKQTETMHCVATIVGGVIAGIGLGMILSHILAGAVLGLGVGIMVAKSKK